jgi:hypothetical protein
MGRPCPHERGVAGGVGDAKHPGPDKGAAADLAARSVFHAIKVRRAARLQSVLFVRSATAQGRCERCASSPLTVRLMKPCLVKSGAHLE